MRRFTVGILDSPLKVFVLIALTFGSLVLLLTPPFTGADEEAHFTRAYSVSSGDLVLSDTTQVAMPKSFRQSIGCFQTKTSQPGVLYRYNYANYGVDKKLSFKCALSIPLKQEDTEKLHTSAYPYSPIAYVAQIAPILVGKLLNLPIVIMVYMVRFSVLIEYILLIALAIKLLPIRKWSLAGIALMPTPIMYINNPGGDHLLLGSAALISSIIIRSIYIPRKQLQKENTRLLTGLAVLSVTAVLSKSLFPGVCLLLLIPFYGGLQFKKYSKIAIIAAVLAISLIWQKIGVNLGLVSQINPATIIEFPKAFVNTMFNRWVDTDFVYMGDYVGNIPTPGEHLGMPSVMITMINILFAVYIFVTYSDKSKLQLNRKHFWILRIAALGCASAIIIGSFAALFVGVPYLQTESDTIRGVGVRYLYPAFFVLAIIPLTRGVSMSERMMARIVLIGSIVSLFTLTLLNAAYYQWIRF